MDAQSRKTFETHLQRFTAEVKWGSIMHEILNADQFELTHVRKVAPSLWLVRAKPPQPIQEGFGLAPEILILAVHGSVQSRDLQRAANEAVRSGLRLDSNLVVVTDDDTRPLQERLDRIPGRDQRVAWTWDHAGHWPPLSDVFRERLPTYDIFNERLPVRGFQLMGRHAEVMSLRTRVARGEAVGVFGLRKMGKTSLVRAVTDELDPASGIKNPDEELTQSEAYVLWIDAEVLDQATVDDVADEMLAALRRRMRAARVSYEPPDRRGIAGIKAAGEALLDEGARLCFVIDEYDFLFEREGGLGPVPGLSRLLRLLRAWAQQWQGSVSLVLIGRDPEHLSTPQLDGVSNPLLAWFTPMWLGPLVPPRDTELLRKLGRRVGLDVGHETAKLAHTWTGGHPMLHRQFGAALREEVRRRVPDASWKTPTDTHCNGAVERFRDRDTVLTVDREIIDLLKKRYRATYELLLDLVEGRDAAAAVTRSGGLHGAGARMLRNFGLLDETTLAIPEHLSWYVRNLLPTPVLVAS
jgi:hypothetical protein